MGDRTSPPASIDRLAARLGRRSLLGRGGLLMAGAAVPAWRLLRASAQNSPELLETINDAVTLEAFAVTFYGAARGRGDDLELSDVVSRFIRVAQCEEEAHFHFFSVAGAVPATSSFTIANQRVAGQERFLRALLEVETLLVGAHMALVRRFAQGGDLRLVEIGYQIGAVEAQHQAMTRSLLGERLPADRAFAKWMFREPADAVARLQELGYIRGEGDDYVYPGPSGRNCRGVTGLVPEATEDQPVDAPRPQASPVPEERG
jgi:hypothetical protein